MDLFTAAATALTTRARLNQLLLDALVEAGLAEAACDALSHFIAGPLLDGRAAMGRLLDEGAA